MLPCRHGEKVVLRLFEPGRRLLALEELGFDATHLVLIGATLGGSHGMILVTGPTGRGKTTTLHACIRRLWSQHINIISVEDPGEYEIAGITQIQINERVASPSPSRCGRFSARTRTFSCSARSTTPRRPPRMASSAPP
jgi:general secretion pathway protein E